MAKPIKAMWARVGAVNKEHNRRDVFMDGNFFTTNQGQQQNNSIHVNFKKSDVESSNILFRKNHRTSTKVAYIFCIIILSIMAIVDISMLIMWDELRYDIKEDDFVFSILIISLTAEVICVLLNAIKLNAHKKNFICATEVGVFGCGGTSLQFIAKPFSFYYEQITKIAYSDGIIIESGGNSYKCRVAQGENTYRDIKINIITKSNQQGVWICSNCGSRNIDTQKCILCGKQHKKQISNKTIQQLEKDIELVINNCKSKDAFIGAMQKIGYTVKWNDYEDNVIFKTPSGVEFWDNELNKKFRKANLILQFNLKDKG